MQWRYAIVACCFFSHTTHERCVWIGKNLQKRQKPRIDRRQSQRCRSPRFGLSQDCCCWQTMVRIRLPRKWQLKMWPRVLCLWGWSFNFIRHWSSWMFAYFGVQKPSALTGKGDGNHKTNEPIREQNTVCTHFDVISKISLNPNGFKWGVSREYSMYRSKYLGWIERKIHSFIC